MTTVSQFVLYFGLKQMKNKIQTKKEWLAELQIQIRNEKFTAKDTSTIRKFSIEKRIKPLLRNEQFILQTRDTAKYVMWAFTLLNKLLRLRTVSKKVYSFIFTNGNNK